MNENRVDLDSLRSALRATTGDEELDVFMVGTIAASIPSADTSAWDVYLEETASIQATFEAHLTGDGVVGHSAPARPIGEFIQRLAASATQISKGLTREDDLTTKRSSRSHVGRGDYLLQAVTPGSMQITISAPSVQEDGEQTDAAFEPVTVQSVALQKFADLLAVAQDESSRGPNTARTKELVSNLSPKALSSLTELVKIVSKENWDLEGTVLQRHMKPKRFSFRTGGRSHLSRVLDDIVEKVDHQVWIGRIDGFRESTAQVYIMQEGRKKSIAVRIPDKDAELFLTVRRFATQKERLFRAYVDVITDEMDGLIGEGAATTRRPVNILTGIDIAANYQAEPLFDLPDESQK